MYLAAQYRNQSGRDSAVPN